MARKQERGLGQGAANRINVTRPGNMPGVFPRQATSEGESEMPGSGYQTVLVERPNSAESEANKGPTREGSVIGNKALPILTTDQRPTGRVG